ncbi:hypothetical protein EVAR_14895_1 [Eumeta japonica]|uniref:Uncharacterized protein n=1 Tax=Eumeta variegata TaxID=151549 RepID=A0A4C1V5C9_EUMVA|nr:hypothetical protein EVAR_14895_1 [Eumeta japonica]
MDDEIVWTMNFGRASRRSSDSRWLQPHRRDHKNWNTYGVRKRSEDIEVATILSEMTRIGGNCIRTERGERRAPRAPAPSARRELLNPAAVTAFDLSRPRPTRARPLTLDIEELAFQRGIRAGSRSAQSVRDYLFGEDYARTAAARIVRVSRGRAAAARGFCNIAAQAVNFGNPQGVETTTEPPVKTV